MGSVIGEMDCPMCGAHGAQIEEEAWDGGRAEYEWGCVRCHFFGSVNEGMREYAALVEILRARAGNLS